MCSKLTTKRPELKAADPDQLEQLQMRSVAVCEWPIATRNSFRIDLICIFKTIFGWQMCSQIYSIL